MNYKEYAESIVNGDIVSGEFMKLACNRFLNDLKRPEFFFNEKKVQFLFKFFSIFKHYTGSASGKPFILEPWQKFILANLYGFYRTDTKKRRFTSGYIEMARKNGKTAFSSILCLFNLIADGEDGAEVLLAANSKEQANIAFEMCSNFSHQLDPTDKQIKPYRNEIKFHKTSSKLKVLAADDSKLDGFNASFGLIDEYHAAPNSKVRDVIKSSMGMRSQPMLITITTAGFNLEGPCKKMRDTGAEVLRGILTDDSTFYAIFSIDEDDDWMDEEVWIKSNPNLGVTVTSDFIKDQVQSAKNNPSEEVGVRTKNINQWVQSSTIWVQDDAVLKVTKPIDYDVFINDTEPEVFIGTDLAATGDLTAVTYLTVQDGTFYFKTKYQLPETALNAKYNKVLYRDWKRQGYLNITPGNVCDYDYITNDILSNYNNEMRITKIGYDPWNSSQWVIKMTEEGMPMEPVQQTMVNLSAPTKLLERLILSEKCVIDDNPITRWCFQNVVLKSDWNDNVRPTKDSYSKKIDGVISMIMALQQWIKTPHYNVSVDVV